MAATMLTQVKINSVDVSSTRLLKWVINETFGDEIREAAIELTKGIYTDIADLRPGMSVEIKRGTVTATDQFVFKGSIENIDKKGAKVVVDCSDEMMKLVNASVTYSYDGIVFPASESKGSDVAKDLIENENFGNMTASVVDTGTDLVLKKFICNGTDVFSRLQILADIYDYQIYYDPDDDKVHFEPKGYTIASQKLYVGGVNKNVSNLPNWKFDNTQCVNRLTVKGAVQEVQDEEYFNGDNSANQVFTLSKRPSVVQTWEDVAGTWTLKTPGVEDSTSGTYHYTIDKENKNVACEDSWTPAVGANNVKVVYTNDIPVPIQVEDTISQGKYGIISAEKFFSDIQTVGDAEDRGNAWLAKYSEPFVKVTVIPATLIDYDVGTKVRIIDIINDEDCQVVINKIKKVYPHKGDQLICGDRDWRLAEWGKFTLERIRRLEEENQKNTDLLISIRNFYHINYHKYRYLKAIQLFASGDGFILDHPSYGVLDTDKLGSPFGSEQTARVVWPDNQVKEKFIDDDFEGSGTATWDVTNRQLIF